MEQSLGIVGQSGNRSGQVFIDRALTAIAFLTALIATLLLCSPQFRAQGAKIAQRWQAYRTGLRMKRAASEGDAARVWQLQRQLQGERRSKPAIENLESMVFGKRQMDKSSLAGIVDRLTGKSHARLNDRS
ncbi:MAG: hypothetical protein ACRECY_17370 [Phyllobacterium sp.]